MTSRVLGFRLVGRITRVLNHGRTMIYLYETIQGAEGGEIKRFEIKQSIHEQALSHHPETGEPIRRVIVGGMGFIGGKSKNPGSATPRQSHGGCGCGHGGCGHG